MKYFRLLLLPIVLAICCMPVLASEKTVSSNDLITHHSTYENQSVVYEGEVIGDIMQRGDNCWINVLNEGMTVGIWMPSKEADKIRITGNYEHQGDMVKIVGRFTNTCGEHGGDFDIHADSITVIKPGYRTHEVIDYPKTITCICLFFISLGFALNVLKKS